MRCQQALWTAAQRRLPVVYVVMRNNEYSILKSFAVLEETPGVPGVDLPGLDIGHLARGFGCRAADVATTQELEQEFKTAALGADTTTVIGGAHATAEGDAVTICREDRGSGEDLVHRGAPDPPASPDPPT